MRTETIYRNSPDTFVIVTINKEGKEFSREIRRTNQPDYGYCCEAFHKAGVAIQVTNKVTRHYATPIAH